MKKNMKEKIIEILKKYSTQIPIKDSLGNEITIDEVLEDDFYQVSKEIEELYSLEYTVNITTVEDNINGIERYKRFKKMIIIESNDKEVFKQIKDFTKGGLYKSDE